jgi:hypothetical protein
MEAKENKEMDTTKFPEGASATRAERMRALWRDPEFRKLHSRRMRARWSKRRELQSERARAQESDPQRQSKPVSADPPKVGAESPNKPRRNGVGATTDEFDLRAEHRVFFAGSLKRRMRESSMNQSDLARAVWQENSVDKRGYTQPKRKDRISAYCSGKVMPQPDTLARIAKVLDIAPKALVGQPVLAPGKTDEHEHFAFKWDGGGSVTIDLKAAFPEAAGREIAALVTKHLEIKESE